MPTRARRRIELLRLSEPLRRYASSLSPDINAASLLVHQALSAAFAEPGTRPRIGLKASLCRDILRNALMARLSQANPITQGPRLSPIGPD